MSRLGIFLYFLLLLKPVFAEESNSYKILYEGVNEKSITVINNPKRIIFDYGIIYSEMMSIIRQEITCKQHTIFIHDIRAVKYGQKPIFIKNEDEPPRILLKTDKHYDIYKKYCL